MGDRDDDILDDLFHGSALAAYLEQAAAQQDWPASEATRRLAFERFEQALAHRNAAKPPER